MCDKCRDGVTDGHEEFKIILDELKYEENEAVDSITQIRTRAAHIMLVTSISLGIFAGLFEFAQREGGVLEIHQWALLFVLVAIAFFFISLYHSFQVIRKRDPIMTPISKSMEDYVCGDNCKFGLYKKLIDYHKKIVNSKTDRRDDVLLPHLNNSTIHFIFGLGTSVLVGFVMLAIVVFDDVIF